MKQVLHSFTSNNLCMEQKKPVGLWIRVSTDMQGDSPKHHEERARMYASMSQWDIKVIYRLEAVSGKSIVERPEFKQMQKDIKAGYITGLIFSKLARLARNTRELLDIADYFQQHQADLISLGEKLDTSTAAGRLFYTMVAAMAQWEREEISARVSASVSVRAKLGKCTGGAAPFGFQWDKEANQLIIDEKEAPVRKLMYELFLETKRKKTTAIKLNKLGYCTRKGSKFTDTTVDRLLRDPSAKGLRRANYTKSRGNKKHWDVKPASEWVFVACPPIVSAELWDKCNHFLNDQHSKQKKRGKLSDFLLAGFIYCVCGEKMYVYHSYPVYRCKGCKNKITVEDIDEMYHSQLKDYLYLEDNGAKYKAEAAAMLVEREGLYHTLSNELKAVNDKAHTLLEMRFTGEMTPQTFVEYHKPFEERRAQIEEQLPQLEGEIDHLKIQQQSVDTVLQKAKDLYQSWPTLGLPEKRGIVEMITKEIIVETEMVIVRLQNLPTPHLSQNGGNKQRSFTDS